MTIKWDLDVFMRSLFSLNQLETWIRQEFSLLQASLIEKAEEQRNESSAITTLVLGYVSIGVIIIYFVIAIYLKT